jgi:hypothetical protein
VVLQSSLSIELLQLTKILMAAEALLTSLKGDLYVYEK